MIGWGCHCNWSRIRMSFNICGRETSYCRIRSRIDHKTSLRTISSVPRCLFEISDVLITCLNSCPNLIQLTSWVSCFEVLQKTLLKMCMQLQCSRIPLPVTRGKWNLRLGNWKTECYLPVGKWISCHYPKHILPPQVNPHYLCIHCIMMN